MNLVSENSLFQKKRTVLVLILGIFMMLFSFITPASAASDGPWPIRPTNNGDYDGAYVSLNTGVSSFQVTYSYKGIHSGEKANIRFNIYDSNGTLVGTFAKGIGDFTGAFNVSGVVPGGLYQVMWESLTNVDTDGSFNIICDGNAFQ